MELKYAVALKNVGCVGLIVIDRPPLNLIDAEMREGLAAALAKALNDPSVQGVVLCSEGTHFMAGVDISEFDGVRGGPSLQEIQATVESASKPIVAAIQGLALGGGLELAMACHYRVAESAAKLGLPEITLGVIPGAGGTQRLPRLVGARKALSIILSGVPLSATEAKNCGLIDIESASDLRADVLAYCQTLIEKAVAIRRTCHLVADREGFDAEGIKHELKVHARALKGRTTQNLVVDAISAAVERPFLEGLEIEAKLARLSLESLESRALRHLFFAERSAGKVKVEAFPMEERGYTHAAVVGAGTMGSGIATALADAGLRVSLIDNAPEGLARGQGLIRGTYHSSVARGRITQAEMDARLQRIQGSVSLSDVANADFVIEAVYENLDLKRGLLRELDAAMAPDKLIATNTSTLSVTELSRATRNPERVAGLHFFSPAHIMKLVEVVRGEHTAPRTVMSALRITRLLRKTAVVANDGFGFIGNRMMLDGYFREAEQLLLEGASPSQLDRALETFGFAMGPQKVSDLGGNDVGTKARQELYRTESRPKPYFVIADRLTAQGKLGQKTGSGFYRYPEGSREGVPDADVTSLIDSLAVELNIARRQIADREIVERCLLSLINVGAAVLDEGVAQSSADIDVVWTSGYGFPRHLGGPMFYADSLGLPAVADRIRHYHNLLGHYWKPAALIDRLAGAGSSFREWDMERATHR